MAFVVACPTCERKLLLPEGCGGMSVRCPSCSASFTAPDSGSAWVGGMRPDEVVAITLKPRRDVDKTSSSAPGPLPNFTSMARRPWEQLHGGLGWILLGAWLGLATVIVRFPGLLRLETSLPGSMPVLPGGHGRMYWCCLGLIGLMAGVCTVAGLFLSVLQSVEGMPRSIGIAALALILVFLLPAAAGPPMFYSQSKVEPLFMVVATASSIGNYIALGFLLPFVRGVGRVTGDRQTLSHFRWLMPLYYFAVPLASVATLEAFRGHGYVLPEAFILGLFLQLPVLLFQVEQIRFIGAAHRAVLEHLITFSPRPIDPEEERQS